MTLDALTRRLWPGGLDDRYEPVAADWLRRWGPVRQVAAPPAGACRN